MELLTALSQVFIVVGPFIALYYADEFSRDENGKSNPLLRDRIVYLICLGGLIGAVAASLAR